jgi:O-antigen/teichoic acid export membrane protein
MLIANLVITLPLSAIAAILSPKLLPLLFGPQFREAVPATIILLIGTVILGCNYILSDGLRGLGYPLIPSIAELAGLVVTVGGLLLVLRTLGILGAAWVSLASYNTTLLGLTLALVHFSWQARSHKSTKVMNGDLK